MTAHECSVFVRYLHRTSVGPVPSSIRMVAGWAPSWTMTAKTWRRSPVTTPCIGVSPGSERFALLELCGDPNTPGPDVTAISSLPIRA